MCDLQNQHDKKALLLRADQPVTLVGYVPPYYVAAGRAGYPDLQSRTGFRARDRAPGTAARPGSIGAAAPLAKAAHLAIPSGLPNWPRAPYVLF